MLMDVVITRSHKQILINRDSFERLYERAFPRVAAFISKMHGSFNDARDLFQDALVIYYEKKLSEGFEITMSEEAYVLGIVKHLWFRKFKHDSKNTSLDEVELNLTLTDELENTPNESKLLDLLERTGKRCLELLNAFYYEKKSVREIARSFRYRSEHSAAVQKFKCLEKIRDTVKEKALNYEDFLE
jgi:RNA polymerase sigma factor (sigma-70 family)